MKSKRLKIGIALFILVLLLLLGTFYYQKLTAEELTGPYRFYYQPDTITLNEEEQIQEPPEPAEDEDHRNLHHEIREHTKEQSEMPPWVEDSPQVLNIHQSCLNQMTEIASMMRERMTPLYIMATTFNNDYAARLAAKTLSDVYAGCISQELQKILREELRIPVWIPSFFSEVDEKEHHRLDQIFNAHHDEGVSAVKVGLFENIYFHPLRDTTLRDILHQNIWRAMLSSSVLTWKLEGVRQEYEINLGGRSICSELPEIESGEEGDEEEHHQHGACGRKKITAYLNIGTIPTGENGLFGNIEFIRLGSSDVEAQAGYRWTF
ncbi:hypothetical protein HYU72_00250 [Candidatus Berkelbacteria bacterium]|nr:hypothetical protein [Candidatus Berkelbacteria bacterium]MBI2588213.1 hypothetical protein [Candidatus Berkelbacteria bacterium]